MARAHPFSLGSHPYTIGDYLRCSYNPARDVRWHPLLALRYPLAAVAEFQLNFRSCEPYATLRALERANVAEHRPPERTARSLGFSCSLHQLRKLCTVPCPAAWTKAGATLPGSAVRVLLCWPTHRSPSPAPAAALRTYPTARRDHTRIALA